MLEVAVVLLGLSLVLGGGCWLHDAEVSRGTIEHLQRRLDRGRALGELMRTSYETRLGLKEECIKALAALNRRAARAWAEERESLRYDRDLLRERREEPRSILADFAEGEVR